MIVEWRILAVLIPTFVIFMIAGLLHRWWKTRDSGYLFSFAVFLMVLPASVWTYYPITVFIIMSVVVFSIAILARVWFILTERAEERAPEEPVQEETQPEIDESETSSPVSPLKLVCPYCGYKSPYYARICARCGRHPGEIIPDEAASEEAESETPKSASLFDVLCFYCSHKNPRDARFCIKCGRYLGETYP